ncbi:pseudouridine synthase [Alteromonas aestuariivivens]|nr:pseudouridine synthase [Alteromonas aestuariivivens]
MISEVPEIRVVYQDDYLVAVDKPAGLLVHRSPIDRHETEFAVQKVRDRVGRHVFPVHRLDRPTSGVLLFAFSAEYAGMLGRMWMGKEVSKQYRALVRGWLNGAGLIDYALRYRKDKYADKYKRDDLPPQPAVSEYQCIERYLLPYGVGRYPQTRYSLVSLYPQTGRKHQLRRHMAHVRHPILGDTTHGDGKHNKFVRGEFNFDNLALTCTQLSFVHPITAKRICISAQPHFNMAALIENWQQYRV